MNRKLTAMNSRMPLARTIALVSLTLFVGAGSSFAADDYTLGPDSQPKDGVPKGEVKGPFKWESKIFPGTVRDYWIYVPA